VWKEGGALMNGQWMGGYLGTTTGKLLINVDDCGSHFEGVAYVRPDGKALPWSGVGFRTPDKSKNFNFATRDLWILHPQTGHPASLEEVKPFYPGGFSVSNEIVASGTWDESHLEISWHTDIGLSGSADLPRSRVTEPSELEARLMNWDQFKVYVANLAGKRHLFRGQHKPWRLRTAFHRHGRADLRRFISVDIKVLHQRLSARTRHIFDLSKPDENGAFFNLVQHHGYPTPLLDWTYSPYVAAFFAFRGVSKLETAGATSENRVRIFVLDESWRTDVNQLAVLDRPCPHLSITEFIAIDNERMVPQQSVSAVTNVDDIETYIRDMEKSNSRSYLSAIDIPIGERSNVFCELAYMGVTAGSLFPGLDGACEELRESNF
jgi:hypothetical protein